MNVRRGLFVMVVVLGASLGVAVWQGRGAERGGGLEGAAMPQAALDQDAQEFQGKLVSLHIDYLEKDAGHVLKDVNLRHLGGHTFLTGTGVTVGPKPNPYDGRTVWIAVDRIIQITVYKDVDEMQKSYDKFHPKEDAK